MITESIAKFLKLDSLISNLTGYVETKIELVKLEVKEDVSKGMAQASVYVLIFFMMALFILFISLAVALELGESLGVFAGFAIVSGFYLVVALILIAFRKSLFVRFEKQVSLMMKKKK